MFHCTKFWADLLWSSKGYPRYPFGSSHAHQIGWSCKTRLNIYRLDVSPLTPLGIILPWYARGVQMGPLMPRVASHSGGCMPDRKFKTFKCWMYAISYCFARYFVQFCLYLCIFFKVLHIFWLFDRYYVCFYM